NSEPVVEAPTIAPSDRIARPFHLIGSPVDDVGQHAGGMVSGVDPVVGPSDLSVLVDEKAHASWPPRLGILACPGRECDRSIVAEEGKLEVILLREPGVRFHAVKAHAENLDIAFVVVVLMVAEPATLGRSARGVCCGVKPQQHLPTPQIGQCYGATVMR